MTAKVDYITPDFAERLSTSQFSKLKYGYELNGTYEGRVYILGYALPGGYWIKWDDAAEDLDNPGDPDRESFWDEYEKNLVDEIRKSPDDYGLHAGENPFSLAHKIRLKFEMRSSEANGLKAINLSTKTFEKTFKAFNSGAYSQKALIDFFSRLKSAGAVNPKSKGGSLGYKINPGRVKIYNRILKIYASKAGMPHQCDDACKRAGHRYVHEFKKKACIHGNNDGSLTIE